MLSGVGTKPRILKIYANLRYFGTASILIDSGCPCKSEFAVARQNFEVKGVYHARLFEAT